jgi:hypothetical protein
MKFKLDENLPIEASTLLREAGHDSITVLDQNMGGKAVTVLAELCIGFLMSLRGAKATKQSQVTIKHEIATPALRARNTCTCMQVQV